MRIYPINTVNNKRTFKANPVKPVKEISEREKNIIKNYITGLSYRLKMTQDELTYFHKIRTRKKLEKDSYQYIAKKLNIPEEILPPLVQIDGNEAADYSYAFLDNIIQANAKLRTPKDEILSSMRHEFQHFLQVCNMLRTEGLGDEVQKYLTQASINDRKDFLTDLIKRANYKKLDSQNSPETEFLNSLSEALSKGDIKTFNNKFKPITESIKQMWLEIRNVSEKHWGIIKRDSYEGRNNKILFEELKKYNSQGDMIDWALNKLEKDAMLAENFVYKEYNGINSGCYIRNEKKIRNALDKNETFQFMQEIIRKRRQADKNV